MIVAGEMKCGLQALKSERHGLLKPEPLGSEVMVAFPNFHH